MKNNNIPSYPFYGYDNAEEMNRDVEYMKGIYPQTVRKILKEIEDECDKLEYDGSIMFDSIPDAVSLANLVDTIYVRVSENTFSPIKTESVYPSMGPCVGRRCPPPPPYSPYQCGPNRPCPPQRCCSPRADYDYNGNPDWVRNLVATLLYNEVIHRRRRYRSRKRWVQ